MQNFDHPIVAKDKVYTTTWPIHCVKELNETIQLKQSDCNNNQKVWPQQCQPYCKATIVHEGFNFTNSRIFRSHENESLMKIKCLYNSHI